MIAPDFKELLPKQASPKEEDDRPIYHLFVFDPESGKVKLDDNENASYADQVTHKDLAQDVHHPDKVQGYAYSIEGGWRITNDEHNEIKDPFIIKRVLQKLRGEYPEATLPHISYHRLPDLTIDH